MKHHALFLLLFLVASTANCKSSKTPAKSDIRRFSSDQLIACYNDKTICGTDDHYAISDELVHRLPKFSTDQLVACFADWKICGAGESMASGGQISDVIARRGNPHTLLLRYRTEPNQEIRDGIVDVAYHFNSPEVAAFMSQVLAGGQGDEDELYWSANYLAKRCDPDGLKWLSMLRGRPEGCIQWPPTVALFGKCRYRPAIPYLIIYSLDDACMNILDAAANDLHILYPDSPKNWSSPEDAQKYYCGRAKHEGFKVDCNAK